MQDCHLHSSFSYDSDTTLETYLTHYDGLVITTEHFDLGNPYTGQDDIPDDEAYTKEVERLNAIYGKRLKKGIEIGYYEPREVDINTYLEGKSFDIKLLSVHHNGRYDYLQEAVFKEPWQDVVSDYLNRLSIAIGRVDADVLAHFDYGFRKLQLTVAELALFESELIALFQKMATFGLAFEINSKSIYVYKNKELYAYALKLLSKISGVNYTVGSDGHHIGHHRLYFDDLERWLLEQGLDCRHCLRWSD